MGSFKQFATNHAIIFCLLIALILLLLHIAAFILGVLMPGEAYGKQIGEALGRLIAAFLLVLILCRFGWLKPAGLTHSGGWQSWLLILPPMIYGIIVFLYLFFGDFLFDFSDPALVSLVTFNQMTVGLIEEIAFRGIILYCLIRLWGNSKIRYL
jgi:membrane protease YdiL (CAAX protease family)